jgi:hypothetical protein
VRDTVTIEQALEAFVEDQRQRLSARTMRSYDDVVEETDQNRGRSTIRAPGDPPEPPGADPPGTDHAPGGLRRTGCQGHHGRDYGCGEQR